MPLNKDILGNSLYEAAKSFNDQDVSPDQLELQRKNFWTTVAEQIINHITGNGEVNVTVSTTGTSTAQTGTGTGTIS